MNNNKHDEPGLDELFSPSEIYHESSKLRPSDIGQYIWINQVNSSPEIRSVISRPYMHYRGCPSVSLPLPVISTQTNFLDIVKERRSSREFTGKYLSLQQLSNLLYVGNGVSCEYNADDGTQWKFRTTPSGGGLFPIEIYCTVNRVDGLKNGLYFYNNNLHALELIKQGDVSAGLIAAMTPLKESIEQSAVCMLLGGLMQRIKFKYRERAYRFVLLETGHIAQNILLAASAENIGALPIGGFLDDELNRFINADGVERAALYAVLLGTH